MTHDEIIEVEPVAHFDFDKFVLEALKYALFSYAFTIDRMDKVEITPRIFNIIKGKVAEAMFYHFMSVNCRSIIDNESTSTPYWMADQRDFIFLRGEWDIKNNFIACDKDVFYNLSPRALPALVPNRHDYDQWSQREKIYQSTSHFSAFVFTFMRLDVNNRNFITLEINNATKTLLSAISKKYANWSYSHLPEAEQQIIEDTFTPSFLQNCYKINYQPDMIITACANRRYWSLFKVMEADSIICEGLFKTRIRNSYCETEKLPPFVNLLNL